jgi:hypothetical protein
MPWLDEVGYYLRGVWLLLLGRLEGLNWLDFSQRGFWRSWWSVAFCLPPMMLEWAGLRIYYLATMPPGVSAGPSFIIRLAIVALASWLLPYLVLAAVMVASGYVNRILPMIVAINWLSIPMQWLGIVVSLALIFDPLDAGLYGSLMRLLLMVSAAAHFLVIRQITDRKLLPAAAFLLTLIVANLWSATTISDFLGL